jgi:hypothetical protein
MHPIQKLHSLLSRRNILRGGALAGAGFAIAPRLAGAAFLDAPGGNTANGSTDPYPIPWLDKNGSHNQPAGPNLEPSHITISKASWPVQALSPEWVLTIKGTGSHSAVGPLTTV